MRGRLKTSAEDSEKLLPRCLKRGCVISRGIRRHPAHSRGEPNTKFWIHESKKLWIITEYDRIYSPEPMWKSDKCPDPEKRVCPTTNSVPSRVAISHTIQTKFVRRGGGCSAEIHTIFQKGSGENCWAQVWAMKDVHANQNPTHYTW